MMGLGSTGGGSTVELRFLRSRRGPPPAASPQARSLERLLDLLAEDRSAPLTISAMRRHGIEMPAQAIYELRLAGYEIERITLSGQGALPLAGYRLRDARGPSIAAAPAAAQEVDDAA